MQKLTPTPPQASLLKHRKFWLPKQDEPIDEQTFLLIYFFPVLSFPVSQELFKKRGNVLNTLQHFVIPKKCYERISYWNQSIDLRWKLID